MKLDKRRKYYMILDCETATLPFVNEYPENVRKNIAIAKPLIYDLGYQIIDRQGRVYKKVNHLITEIFSVPSVFNTAYYKEKRPIYLNLLSEGKINLTDWNTAINELLEDLEHVESVGAYNSMFDFKKAIPFTEKYIKALYTDYSDFERKQKFACKMIAEKKNYNNDKNFDKNNFIFRGKKYPLFDVWGLACKYVLNCDEYKELCKLNNWKSASGNYYSTTAEKAYRFINKNNDFKEAHTALNDSEIESKIFSKIVKKSLKNLEIGIIYFPFRILGKIEENE